MHKIELRETYKDRRLSLNSDTIQNKSLEISNQILQMKIWSFLYYHIFLPIEENKEIDTSLILTLLQGKDKNIVIPKVLPNNQLESYLLTDNTLFKKNKWNISEPVDGVLINEKQLDVVFVPLLAFDVNGNRVGYGKGFYDSFLNKCKPNVLKIGLSFFEAENNIEGISKHDVPLDFCVTPEKVYAF